MDSNYSCSYFWISDKIFSSSNALGFFKLRNIGSLGTKLKAFLLNSYFHLEDDITLFVLITDNSIWSEPISLIELIMGVMQ